MWNFILLLIGAVVGLAIVAAAWLRLSVKHIPVYPPPPDALSPTAARELVERLAVKGREHRRPCRSPGAIHGVLISTRSRWEELLPADILRYPCRANVGSYRRSMASSLASSDELVPILQDKARQGIPARMVVDRFGSAVDFASKRLFQELIGAVQVVRNDAVLLDRDGLLGGDQWIDWRFDELDASITASCS